ncbi:MAG TPA: hypothetical protein VIW25_02610 [Nitrososphaeraceae archaeon]
MNYNKICETQKAIGHIMRVVFAVKEITHQNQATVALVKFTKLLNINPESLAAEIEQYGSIKEN